MNNNNKNKDQLIKSSTSLIEQGLELMEKRQFEGAIDKFDAAIAINPLQRKPYYKKGMCLFQLDNLDEALNVFDKAWDIEWQK